VDGFYFIPMVFTQEKIKQLNTLILNSKSIVITSHKSPDGDSIGSSLGLFEYLSREHNKISICHPDEAANYISWFDNFNQVLTHSENENEVVTLMEEADLIFCLDYNSPGRIGKMDELLKTATAIKVMIDHHKDPAQNFVDLMFSDSSCCSTSQLILELMEARNDLSILDKQIGTPLYAGIVTDTGSFRFSSVTPKTHYFASLLLKAGVEHSRVHENIFDTNTEDKIKLVSFALLEKLTILREYQVAYIALSQSEQDQFNAVKGDTEGLVNQALGIQGVKMAAFFKESDGIIKISFRSIGSIPVNELANENFEGGGHLNAAGGKYIGKLASAIDKFVTILPNFVEKNKSLFE
jgi:phosphoesterase RecJ-like protein